MALPKLPSIAPNTKIPPGSSPTERGGRLSPPGDNSAGVTNRTNHTEIYTLFTIVGQQLFYSAENWVWVTLTLETAGPVAVSTRADVLPVLSGKGMILATNIPARFLLPKGDRLTIAANAVNRVNVQIEPYPFYDGIIQGMGTIVDAIRALVPSLASQLAQSVGVMASNAAKNVLGSLKRVG